MSLIKLKSTDSCTITMKGQVITGVKTGDKVRVQLVKGDEVLGKAEGTLGFVSTHQVCFQKGSQGAKDLALLLGNKDRFVKGQAQDVTIEVLES